MSWYPIAYIVPQYEDSSGKPYSGAVLKFYAAGTSTVLPIAPTYAGLATVTSMQLNSNGNPTYLGAAVIPHLTKDYKMSLYPSQAAADSNTGAIWTYDDIKLTGAGVSGSIVSVASAATVDLNSNVTDYFLVTGTTTITGITLADGAEATVRFEGALTLTNGAFLINIGGASITTAAGDIAVFRGESAGVVRMLDYEKASGTSVVNSPSTVANNGYALNRFNYGLAIAATTGAAVVANRLYGAPHIVGSQTLFNRIGLRVSSAIAGNARLGIYNWANGVPTSLILDCGTVSTGTTGDKELTISQTLAAGIYGLGVVFDAAPSVAVASERNLINYLVGDVSSTGNDVFQYVAHTYGALPASFGTPTYTGTASPSLWLRKV